MISYGHFQKQFENYFYLKKLSSDSYIYLLIYIEDKLIAKMDMDAINNLKALLKMTLK